MKRIMAALLALCVTAGTVSYPAGMHEAKAAEARDAGNAETDILNAESVSDFKYVELANGDLKIIKYKGNATELVIPPEVGGKKVVEIGAGAFRGCSRLESITISKNVKQIRYGEYDENDIYIALFSGCENLTEIIVEEGNAWYSSQEGILYDKDKTALLYCPEGKEGSITILSSIKTINEEIFRGCENLTDIVVDKDNRVYSSVEGILYSKNMTDLYCCPAGKQGSIVIPSGVTSIWSSAFRNCSSLTSIAIPQSVYSIMKDSFFGCSNLTDIVVDEKNECYSSLNGILYKKQSTNASSLTLVCCPEGKLGSIVIPDGVGAIEYMAFYNCMNLISIVIPKSVQYIGYGEETEESSAFKGCGNLTEIIVEEDNIGYRSVDGVLYRYVAGREALVCCPAGKQGRVDVQEGAMFLSSLAFQDCHGLTSITIPKSITRIYDDGGIIANAFKDCSNLEEIIVDEDSKSFSAQEGILYYDAGAILVCCPVGKQGSIVIPSGVTSIGDSAFRNCGSLTSITIPQSVEYIGEYSFFGCSNLTDIVVDKDNREYSSADGILYNKNMTYLNCCPAGKEGSIMIPDGTQSIGQRAFEGCVGLTEVSIPDSVDYIADEYLFDSCSDNICILCMPGSYAEAYARKHNINYTVILKKPQTITASNYTKTVGDAAFSIGASTDGDGELSYQSSDESVVIVSSKGVAAVIGAGTAQVTIAAAETSEYEEAQKVITITVNPASGAGENPPPADLAGTSYDIGGCTYTIKSPARSQKRRALRALMMTARW